MMSPEVLFLTSARLSSVTRSICYRHGFQSVTKSNQFVLHDMNKLLCASLILTLLITPCFSQTTKRRTSNRKSASSVATPPSPQNKRAKLSAEDIAFFTRTIKLSLASGVQADRQGNVQEALAYFGAALLTARQHKFRVLEVQAIRNIGGVLLDVGEYRDAEQHFREALAISRVIKHSRHEARSLGALGQISQHSGDLTQAMSYYKQALAIQQRIGDANNEASTLNNMGDVSRRSGDNIQALIYLEKSLAAVNRIAEETIAKEQKAIVLNNMGTAYYASKDYRQAFDFFSRALVIARSINYLRGESYALNNLGAIYVNEGKYDFAFEHFEQALGIRRRTFDRVGEVATLESLSATCFRATGEKDCAMELLQAAAKVCESINDVKCRSEVQNSMNKLRAARYDSDKP